TTQRYVMSMTPGAELRAFFGSQSAAATGSQNLAGVSDPAVDALIDHILLAKSRDELTIAARTLDRVLRDGHYWVSHWYKAAHNIAFWNKFSWPETKPAYARGVIETWWYDAEKAAKLGAAR
ncbi:MAG: ABC transporter substrate-binding protein, partial [Hyphomicrobiales bacterium]